MARRSLPPRRSACTATLTYGGQKHHVTIGFFSDGQPGEVFVVGAKAGTDVQSLSRDGSILISLALQYGCPLGVMKNAIGRNEKGGPDSLLGAMVDIVAAEAIDA